MASYVVVDYDNAKLSTTDKAALKGLTFDGVNTVVKGEALKHSITINGIAGIAVPLKLVTIDYQGNVQVFNIWVKAGAPVEVNAAYTITPTEFVAEPKSFSIDAQNQMQAFTIPAGATKYSVELTAGETAHNDDATHAPVIFSTGAGIGSNDYFDLFTGKTLNSELKANRTMGSTTASASFLKLYKSDKETAPGKLSEVAYAEFTGALNLQMMREDKAYKGIIRFYNDAGTYLGANSIEVKKVLPTTVPADFSVKTNGINNGVMTVYPTKVTEDDGSAVGEFMLYKTFNNWENHYYLEIDGVTNISNPTAVYEEGTDYAPDKTPDYKGDDSDARIETIAPSIIQNNKSYPANINYYYGKIGYIPEGHGTIDESDYYVAWNTSFNMQFNCWPVDCTYQWSETPVVYYGESTTLKGKITKDGDGNVTDFQNIIKALSPYNGVIDPFKSQNNADNWTNWADVLNKSAEIILITNNSGKDVKNEYYKATWTVVNEGGIPKTGIQLDWIGAQSKPSADVETKVVLRLKDKFGHTHDIPALTFTMKINHE